MIGKSTAITPADQLEARIQRHLLSRATIPGFRVEIHEQGLVLHGFAPTFYAKQLAQHAAMEVSGLPVLANEIEVR